MRIELRMVGRGHWRGMVTGGRIRFAGVGSNASAGIFDAKWLQALELRPDVGLGPDVWALALPSMERGLTIMHVSDLVPFFL